MQMRLASATTQPPHLPLLGEPFRDDNRKPKLFFGPVVLRRARAGRAAKLNREVLHGV